jgi:hypothetical protein
MLSATVQIRVSSPANILYIWSNHFLDAILSVLVLHYPQFSIFI